MAKDNTLPLQKDYRNSSDPQVKRSVQSTRGDGHEFTYKPANKEEREARRRIWDRYNAMKDDPFRKEAEKEWDLGDKMYQMWAPERDPDDWRADIILPDGFSAIQSHMQEMVNLRPRPHLEGVEESDAELEQYCDSVFQFAMDQTEFDAETFKARHVSAIRGTGFTVEEYRYETREVQIPTGFKEGEFTFRKQEIVDYDDVYTRWVDNHSVFIDETAEDIKYANDWVRRDVIDYDIYCAMYHDKPGFTNTREVVPAAAVPKGAGFFKKTNEIGEKQVEILHYENKLTDSYDVLANNVLIRQGPLPNRHKELSVDAWPFYSVPGRIYGMGIPKIIYTLVEERRSIRNISLDRQKMHISKMFFVNDLFDLDEDDLLPRPNGMVRVNTNGLPINQAVMPLEYGDVPGSSLRMDDSLKEDERRAHGMDDRPAIQQGGTATEAAIVKESAQARINLINTLNNWTTLARIGRKKWSNVQFFYGYPRMERIMDKNEWVEKPIYRTIKIKGMAYRLEGDQQNQNATRLTGHMIPGMSRLMLDETYAQYLNGQFDISVAAASKPILSKAIKMQQITEMWDRVMNNPFVARTIDPDKAVRRLFSVNDEAPNDWMYGEALNEEQQQMLAERENAIFMEMERTGKLFAIPGTPKATEAHTLVHLNFTETAAYQALSEPVKAAIQQHIAEEHEGNPNTGSVADAMANAQGQPTDEGGDPGVATGGDVIPPGMPGGPGAGGEMPGDMIAGGDVTGGVAVA